MDTDSEELDDVDFWGRTSPREKSRHEREEAMMEVANDDEYDDDDGDELMDDDPEEDDDVEDVDHMELFGHR